MSKLLRHIDSGQTNPQNVTVSAGRVCLCPGKKYVRNSKVFLRRAITQAFVITTLLLSRLVMPGALAEDDPSSIYYGGEFDDAAVDTSLIRIVSAGFNSSLHASADSLASTFNWNNLPLTGADSARRALAVSTAGPLASLEDLIDGRAELAIVRGDLADRIYTRPNDNRTTGHQELRLVSTHQPILLHIVVRDEFDGSTLDDLKGKRINISGKDAATMTQLSSLLNSIGFNADSYEAVYAPESHALSKLDSGNVDAVVFFDQAPSRLIADELDNHRFRLIGLPELKVQTMMDLAETNEQLRNSLTHYQMWNTADFYNNGQHVSTFGLTSFLLTRADVSQETIDLIINQLSVRPAIENKINDAGVEVTADDSRPWASPQGAFQISTDLSPIPLHSSSQLLLDIFTDAQLYGMPGSTAVPEDPAAALPADPVKRGRGSSNKNKKAEVK